MRRIVHDLVEGEVRSLGDLLILLRLNSLAAFHASIILLVKPMQAVVLLLGKRKANLNRTWNELWAKLNSIWNVLGPFFRHHVQR